MFVSDSASWKLKSSLLFTASTFPAVKGFPAQNEKFSCRVEVQKTGWSPIIYSFPHTVRIIILKDLLNQLIETQLQAIMPRNVCITLATQNPGVVWANQFLQLKEYIQSSQCSWCLVPGSYHHVGGQSELVNSSRKSTSRYFSLPHYPSQTDFMRLSEIISVIIIKVLMIL